MLEAVTGKRRILEIYLKWCGVFGAEVAVQYLLYYSAQLGPSRRLLPNP